MSGIDYKKLRKSGMHSRKVGLRMAIGFTTYAEALFEQAFVSRKPLDVRFTKRDYDVDPVNVPGQAPQVYSEESDSTKQAAQELAADEKKELLSSFDKYVSDNPEGSVSFKGGSVKKAKDSVAAELVKELSGLTNDYESHWIDGQKSSAIKILFVGERPKDFDDEAPMADLQSKMIRAMKLDEGSFSRVFLSKDKQEAASQWFSLLSELSDFEELVIVSMGALATNIILEKKERLSRIHGQQFTLQLKHDKGESTHIKIYPVFHPDFLQINPNMKRSAWMDLQKVMKELVES